MSDLKLDADGNLVATTLDLKKLVEDSVYRAAKAISINHLRMLADRGLIPPWYVDNVVMISFEATPAESVHVHQEQTEPVVFCPRCGLETEWLPVYEVGRKEPVAHRSKCCVAKLTDETKEHPYR